MSNNTNAANSSGISLPVLTFFVFLVLKLTGHIAWSWVWVFAPLWIPAAIVVVIALLAALIGAAKGKQ